KAAAARAEPSPPAPLPLAEGGAVAGTVARAGRPSPLAAAGLGRGLAPSGAVPSAAAFFTSAMVATPPAPVGVTRARSTLSFFASARTAGMALTPPMATACSLRTASELCMAPTTVPASAEALAAGASGAGSAAAGAGGSGAAAGLWPCEWPVSWASARCGREGSISISTSQLPVAITSPGPPARRSTLPEYGEGTSTTALAVSIDTSGSSSRTTSPTPTSHSTISASGRPSPRSGSRNSFLSLIVATSAGRQRALGGGDDLLHARQVLHLEPEQRDMGVVAGDALDRRHQVVHGFLGQAGGDLGAEAGGARGLVHDHAAAGAGDRLADGVEIQRPQRGDVDDLGADALGGQGLGGLQGFLHLRAPADQGDVAAVAQHVAHVQRQRLAVVGHFFLVLAVDPLGLHEDDRIRVADRRQQQAVGALRAAR